MTTPRDKYRQRVIQTGYVYDSLMKEVTVCMYRIIENSLGKQCNDKTDCI